MCDLFTRGLQVVGIKKRKFLMRNGDHTPHVALTTFKILKKTQVLANKLWTQLCGDVQNGPSRTGCSSPWVLRHLQQLWMWPRVPVHSTGNQALGHSSLPSPLPAAACDFFSRNLGNIRGGEAGAGEGRVLYLLWVL